MKRERTSAPRSLGLCKVENLVAACLALLVFVTAYEIARRALFAPAVAVRVDGWMLAALVVGAALPLVFSRYELRAGVAANSPALIAVAKEYRVHAVTAALAFAALAAAWSRLPIDRIAALIIVVAVAKTGWDLLRDAMRVLLDASLDAQTLLQIRGVIEADPGVAEIKWVTGRNPGRFRFVESGVALRAIVPKRAESVVGRIESSVRAAVSHVERVLVHVEAAASPYVRYAAPLADRENVVSEHFGEAPYFALVAVRRTEGTVAEQRVLPNPHTGEGRAEGIRVAEWLVAEKVDIALAKEDLHGKGPVYVLRDAGVELRVTDRRLLSEALSCLRLRARRHHYLLR
ncbi:MAG: cation diffusion facilitator family transporter [Burkholderiales bacterium]